VSRPDDRAAEFASFVVRLERRLLGPLPGLAAQLAMAPRPRRARPPPGIDPSRPIPAAVLALLFPGGEPCLVLTRRTDRVETHKGQICLPGGAVDRDETPIEAALREADEEIGVARAAVRIVGALTPIFIPVSGFRMEPFVAVTDRRPDFRAAASEVDEVIEVPLSRLRDPRLRGERRALRDGHPVVVPYFEIGQKHVWGATAMVLAELCALLDDVVA